MAGRYRVLMWRVVPLAGFAAAFVLSMLSSGANALGLALPMLGLLVLMGVVFACVWHADIIAHKTGEPYGTLVLTVAVTVIEVALILSIMLAGEGKQTLARETVFSVIMVVCNGVVGLCLILGGLRYGEQGFRLPGASAYLVVLMPLATLTLILPTWTTSIPGPFYTNTQLAFVSLVTIILYAVFLYVQTVRHRDYFLSDLGGASDDHAPPGRRQLWESVVLLLVGLVAVVLLAKGVAGSIETAVVAVARRPRPSASWWRCWCCCPRRLPPCAPPGATSCRRASTSRSAPRSPRSVSPFLPYRCSRSPCISSSSSASTCTTPSCWS